MATPSLRGGLLPAGCCLLSLGLSAACSGPDPAARLEVAPGITGVLAGSSYAYVMHGGPHGGPHGGDRVALIDAGSDPTGAALLDELARRGLEVRQVEAILVTHGHRNHWAAAALFSEATVYAADAAHRMIRGDRRVEGFGPWLEAHLAPAPPIHQRLRSLLPRTLLEVAGRDVDVFALPGHTRGSLAFLVDGVLFTGDSLRITEDGLDAAPASTSGDRDINRRALHRLEAVPFTIIADGHRGVAHDGAQRFARWLAAQR